MATGTRGQLVQEAAMATDNGSLCDCPEPCAWYAAGYA